MIPYFPYEARRIRKQTVKINYGPDCPNFTKKFFGTIWSIVFITFAFTLAAIVILILMGALKLIGVKEL